MLPWWLNMAVYDGTCPFVCLLFHWYFKRWFPNIQNVFPKSTRKKPGKVPAKQSKKVQQPVNTMDSVLNKKAKSTKDVGEMSVSSLHSLQTYVHQEVKRDSGSLVSSNVSLTIYCIESEVKNISGGLLCCL